MFGIDFAQDKSRDKTQNKSFDKSNSKALAQGSKNTPKRAGGSRDHGITILTSGCHFSGKLYCKGSTRIGGKVEGQITAEGLLVIEDEALVQGEIIGDEIIVQGQVVGIIEARGKIELCASSRVQADITSQKLVIQEGAEFNGNSVMKSTSKSEFQRIEPTTADRDRDSFPAIEPKGSLKVG